MAARPSPAPPPPGAPLKSLSATPYMALGAILRAGLDGLHREIPLPAPLSVIDIARLTEEERRGKGILPLPKGLGEALDCLENSGDVLMPKALRAPYIMHKRAEIAEVADLPPGDVFTRYARAY